MIPFLSRQLKYASRCVQHCARSSRLGAAGVVEDEAVAEAEELSVDEDEPNPNIVYVVFGCYSRC